MGPRIQRDLIDGMWPGVENYRASVLGLFGKGDYIEREEEKSLFAVNFSV